MTNKLEEMTTLKKELKLTKKEFAEMTEANRKMEIELENRHQIDSAIDYLR